MPNLNMLTDNFSSRIKKVFIELKNYSYFHGSSEIGKIDRRFIGRANLIKRFKAILNFSETQSGTYLITGYRGMGKSSFVSRVIDELSGSTTDMLYILRRLVKFAFILIIISFSFISNWPILILAPIVGVTYSMLAAKDYKNLKNISITYFIKIFQEQFILKLNTKQNRQWLTLLSNAFLVSFIYLCAYFSCKLIKLSDSNIVRIDLFIVISAILTFGSYFILNYKLKFKWLQLIIVGLIVSLITLLYLLQINIFFIIPGYLIIVVLFKAVGNKLKTSFLSKINWFVNLVVILSGFVLYYVYHFLNLNVFFFILIYLAYLMSVNFIYLNLTIIPKHELNKGIRVRLFSFIRAVYRSFESIKNFSQKFYIKINLGYSGLKELDILRLIAKNILAQYEEASRSLKTKILWKVFIFIIVYCITGLLYYQDAVYLSHNALKQNNIVKYFLPSQHHQILSNKPDLLEDIIYFLKKKGNYNYENYTYLAQLLEEDVKDNNPLNRFKNLASILESRKNIAKFLGMYQQGESRHNALYQIDTILVNKPKDIVFHYYHLIGNIVENQKEYYDTLYYIANNDRFNCQIDSLLYIMASNTEALLVEIDKLKNRELKLLQEHHHKYIQWQDTNKADKLSLLNTDTKVVMRKLFKYLFFIRESQNSLTNFVGMGVAKTDTIGTNYYINAVQHLATVGDTLYKPYLSSLVDNLLIDKNISAYLNPDDLVYLPVKDAISFAKLKKKLYLDSYDGIHPKSLEEILKPDSVYEDYTLDELEVIALMKHLNENKNTKYVDAVIKDSVLNLENLYRLNRVIEGYSEISTLSKPEILLARITSNIDLFLYVNYSRIREFIIDRAIGNQFANRIQNKEETGILLNDQFEENVKSSYPFLLIPYHIDYLFIIYLILVWQLFRVLMSLNTIGYTNKKNILKRLRILNDSIDAQVTTDEQRKYGGGNAFFNLFRSKRKNYPIADEREIEKELIEIIALFKDLPFYRLRAEFVFIFDELDKIYPHRELDLIKNANTDQKEASFVQSGGTFFSPEGTRKRQHAVLSLLSNLKYFLTTAKSKFIFIAGREMYDAYLADVSDRNFVIGSIFHEVLYINSFLTESSEKKQADITSMTEEYVCQFILPENYTQYGYSLKSFNNYLINEYTDEFGEHSDDELENQIARLKREKIIYLLQHFITYLTHISSGSPNKITSYFENHVSSYNKINLNDQNCLFVGESSKNLYLAFNYFDQYKMSMINFLVTPCNLAIANTINSVKSIGDKLLVSTSFVIDHLFKFHRFGFSWRNIESTPEVLDVTKSSELRDFINKIILYLMNSHIEEIVTGLYTFRFSKRISQEIGFLSKVSEEASAILNFVLDESLAVKQHYHKLLTIALEQKDQAKISEETAQYYHSLAGIYQVLGDLHFYDEEYGDAINSYLDMVQVLRNIRKDQLTIDLLAVLARGMLKLGLALEKRKTYSSAFLIYGEIAADIAGFNLSTDKLTELNLFFSGDEDRYSKNLAKRNYQISAYEGLKFFYQPLLARFQIIEKSHLGGITKVDIVRTEQEFLHLHKTVARDEKYLLKTEFWNKLGNILYFKNAYQSEYGLLCSNELYSCIDYLSVNSKTTKPSVEYITVDYKKLCNKPCIGCRTRNSRIGIPCNACQYYEIALINLLEKLYNSKVLDVKKPDQSTSNTQITEKNIAIADEILLFLVSNIEGGHNSSKRLSYKKALANLVSDYGDVLLSCINPKDDFQTNTIKGEVKAKDIGILLDVVKMLDAKTVINSSLSDSLVKLTGLGKVLIYYYLSGILYKKAGEHKSYTYQITKILKCLVLYVKVQNNDNRKEHVKSYFTDIKKNVVNKAIRALYQAYDSVHNYEIERYKDIFYPDNSIVKDHISLNRSSICSELDELVVAFSDLELLSGILPEPDNASKDYLHQAIVTPYNLVSNMHNRILQLRHKVQLNQKIIDLFDFNSIATYKPQTSLIQIMDLISKLFYGNIFEQQSKALKTYGLIVDIAVSSKQKQIQEVFEFLVFDSIFCQHQIIKLLNIYGKSYCMNHSFAGNAHLRLCNWSAIYQAYLFFIELVSGIRDIIETNANESKLSNLLTNKLRLEKSTVNKCIYVAKEVDQIYSSDMEEYLFGLVKYIRKKEKNIETPLQYNNPNSPVDRLSKLIEPNNLPFIAPIYQAERAIKEFYKAIETHSEGKAYKAIIGEMYYLNDDYNDKMYHFAAAYERYFINSRLIDKDIRFLKGIVQNSEIYNYDNYMQTRISN